MGSTIVGFTGHQGLDSATEDSVHSDLLSLIRCLSSLTGICSLAEGSDQIFASTVLEAGGSLVVVVPCQQYETTFETNRALTNYRYFLSKASKVIELDILKPSEEAYWAAGKRVVEEAQRVIAVWDGNAAAGLGGTADIVKYARGLGKQVDIIWPKGAARR